MKIIYSKEVIDFLSDLIEILYDKNYLGFKSTAQKYVEELVKDIDSTISHKHPKFAPPYFARYGTNLYYVSYRRNKNTTWYIFFNYSEGVYLIRFIGNNHNIGKYL